jgi:3-deoxy-manno-octulosonate cytidylyltransferase (CMP-KDO synthetase)
MTSSLKAVGIIPARYDSSRFPGKPLAQISGKYLIQRVYERVSHASTLSSLLVATDDKRIFDAVKSFGGQTVMTREDHLTGTDRLAEAAMNLDCDIVVNIQGDEPLIDPDLIDRAVSHFSAIPDFRFGSAMTPIEIEDDLRNPNIVKVVVGKDNQALYFSRYPIPYRRKMTPIPTYQHIGFYVYSRDFLIEYSNMPATALERAECLEQLRALECGVRIDMIETKYRGIGVDVPDDVLRIERELRLMGLE